MPKLSSLLSITALVLALAACQRADNSTPKIAEPVQNAPVNAATELPENANLAPIVLTVPTVDAGNLSEALRNAEQAFAASRFEDHDQTQPAALEWYLAILRFDEGNSRAQTGLKNTIDVLIQTTQQHIRNGNLAEAERLLQVMHLSLVQGAELDALRVELSLARQAAPWQKKAQQLENQKKIIASSKTDPDDNAVSAYKQALKIFPDYQPALKAIDRLRSQRERAALTLARQGKFEAALIALDQAGQVDDQSPGFLNVSRHVRGSLNQAIQQPLVLANLALDGMKIETAQTYYLQAKKILPAHPAVLVLARRIDNSKHYDRFAPRQSFNDAWAMSNPAPDMVVIPYGKFEMGAPLNLPSAKPAEKPRHIVTFERGFAIARNEITVAQFRQFVESSGYQTRASSRGWSMVFDEKGGSMTKRTGIDWRHDHLGRPAKDDLPVVHVNLADANAYAKWLSDKTGESYRLPSEAEFEYVLRAGKDFIYPWGNQAPDKVVANLAGAGDKSTQSRSWGNAIAGYRDFHWGGAPVGSFPQEAWGTFDMSGNVEEWVQDCWHDSYQRAPNDSTAWVNPGCKTGVTRGASWASSLDEARASFRTATPMKAHNARTGFRVVRVL